MQPSLGPLAFDPILKRLRWGGRRLGTVLHKPIGAGSDFAESWEVCDRGADQSVVASGPFRGSTLHQLVEERRLELFGRHAELERFPLLIKFLDASDRLSVQVHPNDEQAQARHPGEPGKTEAWVILDATPGSCVYAGLQPGVTRDSLAAAIRAGAAEPCLHRVPVVPGDCLFIPAGTVHAIGEGILLAEVQQSSDVTYRLFDWNRTGPDGQPRTLHIDDALACTDFDRGPVDPVVPRVLARNPTLIEELVRCQYFHMLRHTENKSVEILADDRCHVLIGLEGEAEIRGAGDTLSLARGETRLLPAGALPQVLTPQGRAVFLEVVWD